MERTKGAAFSRTIDLCYIALFTTIITIMAQIAIPMPAGVPLTLQTLAVPLAGIVLGPKKGTISNILYILLAAVGVPVLANMRGGIGMVLGVTGGFIISFPIMALMSGMFADKGMKSPMYWMGLLTGVIINYVVGTVWYMAVAHSTLTAALAGCVIPFIPTAIIKLILSGILGETLKKALKRAKLL